MHPLPAWWGYGEFAAYSMTCQRFLETVVSSSASRRPRPGRGTLFRGTPPASRVRRHAPVLRWGPKTNFPRTLIEISARRRPVGDHHRPPQYSRQDHMARAGDRVFEERVSALRYARRAAQGERQATVSVGAGWAALPPYRRTMAFFQGPDEARGRTGTRSADAFATLRNSKPVTPAAGLGWALIGAVYTSHDASGPAAALECQAARAGELPLCPLATMTYSSAAASSADSPC
jgi:hypothetical protein